MRGDAVLLIVAAIAVVDNDHLTFVGLMTHGDSYRDWCIFGYLISCFIVRLGKCRRRNNAARADAPLRRFITDSNIKVFTYRASAPVHRQRTSTSWKSYSTPSGNSLLN
jgi:hypothetical protein